MENSDKWHLNCSSHQHQSPRLRIYIICIRCYFRSNLLLRFVRHVTLFWSIIVFRFYGYSVCTVTSHNNFSGLFQITKESNRRTPILPLELICCWVWWFNDATRLTYMFYLVPMYLNNTQAVNLYGHYIFCICIWYINSLPNYFKLVSYNKNSGKSPMFIKFYQCLPLTVNYT